MKNNFYTNSSNAIDMQKVQMKIYTKLSHDPCIIIHIVEQTDKQAFITCTAILGGINYNNTVFPELMIHSSTTLVIKTVSNSNVTTINVFLFISFHLKMKMYKKSAHLSLFFLATTSDSESL